MKIAVLGAGAMGMLVGGYLSTANDVTLIDINTSIVDKITQNGVKICENDGSSLTVFPAAVTNTRNMACVDLMIVFVKAMYSQSALEENTALIGSNTYIMTLQNGAGHEEVLLKFTDAKHVVIGTTQQNSFINVKGEVCHGGSGDTHIGNLTEDTAMLQSIADAFNASGLKTIVNSNVKKLIWRKLMTNASASVLTGVLQCPLGFIAKNQHAFAMCKQLIDEAVAVANAQGLDFDPDEELETVRTICLNAPNGFTSIYADISAKRLSEVDTISGSIVKMSKPYEIHAHTHSFIVNLVHAIEALY